MKRGLILVVCLWAIAACQPLSVSTQADPYTDFSRYQSFGWLKEKKEGSAENPLLEKQFKFALEQELERKGFYKDAKQPDFLIGFYATQQQKTAEQTIESTRYWPGRSRYFIYDDPRYRDAKLHPLRLSSGTYTRTAEVRTIDYKEGSLVIDFMDAESKQLIWQATLQGVIDEKDPLAQLDKAMVKALKQFPPQQ